ncbi:MAG TPA: hypothetical protein VGI99_05690, partial [Gemmataceae bacterium]
PLPPAPEPHGQAAIPLVLAPRSEQALEDFAHAADHVHSASPQPGPNGPGQRLTLDPVSLKALADTIAKSSAANPATAQMNSTLMGLYQLQSHQVMLAGGVAPPAPGITAMPSAFSIARKQHDAGVSAVSNLGAGGIAGSATRIGGFASGLHSMGMPGGASMTLAALPLAAAKAGMDTSLQLARIHRDDPFASMAQKNRSSLRLLPGGGYIQDIHDAFTGRQAAMDRARMIGEVDTQHYALKEQQAGLHAGLAPQIAGARALHKSYSPFAEGLKPVYSPVVDRSTASGEQAYRDAARLLPLKKATLATERELRVATAERMQAEHGVVQQAERIKKLEAARSAAEKRRMTAGDRDGNLYARVVERDTTAGAQAAHEVVAADDALQEARRGLMDRERGAHDARGKENTARLSRDKAKINEDLIGKAELYQDRANTGKRTAVRLGSMDPLERQMSAQAAIAMKQYGPDAMPEDMRAAAAAAAPMEAEKAFENAGAASPAYAAMQKAGIVDAPQGGKPQDFQKKADEARRDADKATSGAGGAEADYAARGSELGEKLMGSLDKVLDAMMARVEQRIRDQEMKMRQGR